jgi:hypothetical protein
MNHYASGASAVVEHLDLRNAIHVGHVQPIARLAAIKEHARQRVVLLE